MNDGKKNNIQDIEITQLELAEILGYTSMRISQLSKIGVLPRTPDGRYNLKNSVQKFIEYKIEKERNSDNVLKGAERRKAVAEAGLIEIKLDTTKGKLIPVDKVIEDWQKVIIIFRTRILAVSTKVAPLLIGLRSIKRIKAVIDPELYEALNELSRINKV